MAHKERILSEDVKMVFDNADVNHFWNVDKEVGWGCKNYWDDVLLIQYLLNSVNGAKLVEDGIFGKKTYKAILSFQRKIDVFKDGKIDVPDGTEHSVYNSTGTTISWFTIHMINRNLWKKNSLYYWDLRIDPKLPVELCSVFSGWKNE